MRKYNEKSNICGELIEKYRIKQDISREDLAKKLQLLGINIDRSSILRIEKGIVILKDFELLAICQILNIDYGDLLKQLNLD